MSFTFNTSTNIGKVRALIGDTNEASYLLSDEEINVFLGLTDNDVLSSAAMGLRSIASQKALLEKAMKSGDYSENNKGIAKALNDLADKYDAKAESIPAEAVSESFLTDFNYNELLRNKDLRDEAE